MRKRIELPLALNPGAPKERFYLSEEAGAIEKCVRPPRGDAVVAFVGPRVVARVVGRRKENAGALQPLNEAGWLFLVGPLVHLGIQVAAEEHAEDDRKSEWASNHKRESDVNREAEDEHVAIGFDEVVARDVIRIRMVRTKRPHKCSEHWNILVAVGVGRPVNNAGDHVGQRDTGEHQGYCGNGGDSQIRAHDRPRVYREKSGADADANDLQDPMRFRVRIAFRRCTPRHTQ